MRHRMARRTRGLLAGGITMIVRAGGGARCPGCAPRRSRGYVCSRSARGQGERRRRRRRHDLQRMGPHERVEDEVHDLRVPIRRPLRQAGPADPDDREAGPPSRANHRELGARRVGDVPHELQRRPFVTPSVPSVVRDADHTARCREVPVHPGAARPVPRTRPRVGRQGRDPSRMRRRRRYRYRLLRGLRPEDDEQNGTCERDQEKEHPAPGVASVAKSSDAHGEARQQDRDAPKTGEQRTEVGVVSDPDHVEEVERAATRTLKSAHHQNSSRAARPMNSAYLRKTVWMASPNDMETRFLDRTREHLPRSDPISYRSFRRCTPCSSLLQLRDGRVSRPLDTGASGRGRPSARASPASSNVRPDPDEGGPEAALITRSVERQDDCAARPASTHGCHTVGLASIHFCAASAGSMSSLMSFEMLS